MCIHNIRKTMCVIIGLMLGVISSTATQAACVQSDFAGTWYTYTMSVDTTGVISPQVDRCKFKVNSSGSIVASKSSCKSRNSSGTFVTDVTGGNVKVSSKCKLSGSVDFFALGVPFTNVLEDGRLSKDKITSSMIGYTLGTGIIMHATAVK